MSRIDEDAKKWRRDVGLDSVYSGARPAIPRLLALAPLAAALTALAVCLPTTLRPLALEAAASASGRTSPLYTLYRSSPARSRGPSTAATF